MNVILSEILYVIMIVHIVYSVQLNCSESD